MRLWLKDSERRPDPEPVQTDDRMPICVGIAAWVVALVLLLLSGPATGGFGAAWPVTCGLGIVLGGLGLLYVIRRQR